MSVVVTLSASDAAAVASALRCAVCFETFVSPATLACGHSFCRATCLAPWLESNSSCPVCREHAHALPPKNVALAVAARVHRGLSETEAAAEEARAAPVPVAPPRPPAHDSAGASGYEAFMRAFSLAARSGFGSGVEYYPDDEGDDDYLGEEDGESDSEVSTSFESIVEDFREHVLELVLAAEPGEAVTAAVLGSDFPRSERPDPERSLLDQVEDYVPGVLVERGGRGGGRVAAESNELAAFNFRVRAALRAAGGRLSGSELGSRVRQRLAGGNRLVDQVIDHVDGVVVSRHAPGGWEVRLQAD